MKKIGFLILTAATLFAVSCTGGKKTDDKAKTETVKTEEKTTADDHHNAKNSLDYYGTYKGELPAASGSMMMTITLDKGDKYTQTVVYTSDPNAKPFENKGDFKWEDDGNTIVFDGIENGPNKYKVGEGTLTQLDMDGKVIEGPLAQFYVLKQVSEDSKTE